MNIGIYGISSQSGKAYFADFIGQGHSVTGYARPTHNGRAVVECILQENGIYLERPENSNQEQSRFIDLGDNVVTNDIGQFSLLVDVIIVAIPSVFHEDVARELKPFLDCKKIPLVLSPSRTLATPYLWKILGEKYPIVCFSTAPYSSKSISANVVHLKRRKRTWLASLEGDVDLKIVESLKFLFPQVTFTDIPALTSLNNFGAIFHPTAYLYNLKEIEDRKRRGLPFSFYIEGIATKPKIGEVIERIDQTRLKIAEKLGLPTFGLREDPREEIWKKITGALRVLEEENDDDIDVLRKTRRQFLEYINNCVVSSQHWLDITYGVSRRPNESLANAIARTPTYQTNSVAQERYLEEDLPTGLVPLEALAVILDVEHEELSLVIDTYTEIKGIDIREKGRNLRGFSKDSILEYLIGKERGVEREQVVAL